MRFEPKIQHLSMYRGWQSSHYDWIQQHGLRNKVSRLTFITYSWTELCSCTAGTGGYHQSLTKRFHPGTAFSLNQTSCWLVHTWAHIPKHHLTAFTPSVPARRRCWSKTGIDDHLPSAQGASRGQQTFPVEPVVSSQLFLHSLMTTGLFQRGHFEQLATFGAPNHVTWVSKRSPWHRAHLGSP